MTILAWDPWFLVVVGGDRARRSEFLDGMADARDPGFIAFLRNVDAYADRDDSIGLIVPPEAVGQAYPWYLYRAEWTLAGRQIHPLFDPLSLDQHHENIERADLLVLWKARPNPATYELLMQHGEGAIAKRR